MVNIRATAFFLSGLMFFLFAQPVHAEGLFRELIKRRIAAKLGSGQAPAQGDVRVDLDFQGRSRYYFIHIPPGYHQSKPTPLVFVIHGGGGNPAQIEKQVDFTPLSDRDNILLVYPAGSSEKFKDVLLTWNTTLTDTYADKEAFDDVGFLLKILDDVSSKYNIDRKRVYSTGMSQGGMMSYRLACDATDKFAAVAPVAGSFVLNSCHPSTSISVMAFNGLKDGHVTYNGEPAKHVVVPHASVSDAFSFWVNKNGLSSTPAHEETIGQAQLKMYGPGTNGVEVGLWTLNDGGHAWPGKQGERMQSEPTNLDIQATEKIWEFFKKHSRV